MKADHNEKAQRPTIVYLTLATLPSNKANVIQTVRMCDAFARRGCLVYLLAPCKFGRSRIRGILEEIRNFYGIKTQFKLIPLIPPLLWTRNKKINVIVHLLTSLLYVFTCIVFVNLLKKLQHRKVFLFTRTPLLLIMLQVLRCLLGKMKIIYESHNIQYELKTQGKLKPLFIRGLECASLIVSISRSLAVKIKRIMRGDVSVMTLHDAHDPTLLKGFSITSGELRADLGLPQDKWIVAYIGQLWPWKKPEFIIDAFRFVKDHDVILLFVGGSEQDIRRLREYAARINVKNVIFKKFVQPSIVPKYLMAADCLVHYTPSTGLLKSYSPLKIFEYMAAGKPILAPRQPWIEEVLKDGETALLFDEDSPCDLAEKIKLLRRDKELAKRISRNAKLESSKYTYEKRAEKLIEVLMRL